MEEKSEQIKRVGRTQPNKLELDPQNKTRRRMAHTHKRTKVIIQGINAQNKNHSESHRINTTKITHNQIAKNKIQR